MDVWQVCVRFFSMVGGPIDILSESNAILSESVLILLRRIRRRRSSELSGTNSEPRTQHSELLRESRHARVRLLLRGLFAHDTAEEFGQRGVEGGACQLLDLLQGFVVGESGSFWFYSGQVVKHLGDADDASEQGRTFFL
jgi:hypothetical protein